MPLNIHTPDDRDYRIETFANGLPFHEGPIDRVHHGDGDVDLLIYNGIFIEDLIVTAIQRLQQHQEGEFRCRENALAITNFEQGLHWLQARADRRDQAGVLGTYEKAEGDGA